MRLQVFLSRSGACSRRKALKLVQEGQIKVGGIVIKEPSFDVDARNNNVYLGLRKVELKENSYIVLNKPRGYVTTLEDRHASRIVSDLLPGKYKHLYPVGRLDKDSEGLLLFTNDGDLTFRLLHPSFKVDKVYLARINGRLTHAEAGRLESGVVIEGRRTSRAKVKIIYSKDKEAFFKITIHEGRKRQIRLMLAKLGHKVTSLKRIEYGPICLGNLKPGGWRALSNSEIGLLKGEITGDS